MIIVRVQRDRGQNLWFADLALYQQGGLHEHHCPSRRVEKEAPDPE